VPGISASFSLRGIPQLKQKLKRLSDKVRKKGMKEAVDVGAGILLKGVRKRVPRKTGHGKRSLHVVRKIKRFSANATVSNKPETFYLRFVEYGFFNVRTNREISAQPFMRNTFDSDAPRARHEMVRRLTRFIEYHGNT